MAEAKKVERQLRILCLHGYFQSGDIFSKKTGSFRSVVEIIRDASSKGAAVLIFSPSRRNRKIFPGCKFIYVTAPHKINDKGENGEDVYSWWGLRDVSQFLVTKEYIGFQETLDFLKKVFTEQGPFDGVLGFSQGGTLASIICALRQSIPEFKFNFAMIFSAFPTSVPEYNQLYKTIPADFHCLQSYGQGDTLIHATESKRLVTVFPSANLTEFEHPGGHFVPTTSASKPIYRDFMTKVRAFIAKQESEQVN